MEATFQARTACRPQNQLGMLKGIAQIYVGGREYGYRIFWGDIHAASGGGGMGHTGTLLPALQRAMGAYRRAFDTCWKCRK